jgi:2-polyprenyl-3-methyl-5-hydroxy-6-metoxy-1,4-benzoquinol methylase
MKKILLHEIDFTALDVFKTALTRSFHRRTVYKHKTEKKYIKVWDAGYHQSGRFLDAYEKGFYNEIACMEGVIFDEQGNCRGYATPEGTWPPVLIEDTPNKLEFFKLQSHEKQNTQYNALYNKLIYAIKNTDIVYWDLTKSNIAEINGNYYLVDLCTVGTFSEFRKDPDYPVVMECIPSDFKDFIIFQDKKRTKELLTKAWSIPTEIHNGGSYNDMEYDGEHYKGERKWSVRWDTIMKVSRIIKGKRVLELGSNIGLASIYSMKYAEAKSATAVDRVGRMIDSGILTAKALGEKVQYIHMDLEINDYESILGNDYDVVFCMSILKWVTDKNRFLKYLSNFNFVIYEGHNTVEEDIATFKSVGFEYHKILGATPIYTYSDDKTTRTLILFIKDILLFTP